MWTTPKTNWTSNDTFEASDYNRIKGNLEFLADAYTNSTIFDTVTLQPMEEQQVGNNGRVCVMNLLPHNLYLLNQDTLKYLDIVDVQYVGNTIAPNYEEWNRLESMLLRLYDALFTGYEDIKPHIPRRLGNRKEWGRRI